MITLPGLTADLPALERDQLRRAVLDERADDIRLESLERARDALRASGADLTVLGVLVNGAAHQLRRSGVVSFRQLVADLLGGSVDSVEHALVQLAREQFAALRAREALDCPEVHVDGR